jgi:hypothetical protein
VHRLSVAEVDALAAVEIEEGNLDGVGLLGVLNPPQQLRPQRRWRAARRDHEEQYRQQLRAHDESSARIFGDSHRRRNSSRGDIDAGLLTHWLGS